MFSSSLELIGVMQKNLMKNPGKLWDGILPTFQ
jgi:hypothetical protein